MDAAVSLVPGLGAFTDEFGEPDLLGHDAGGVAVHDVAPCEARGVDFLGGHGEDGLLREDVRTLGIEGGQRLGGEREPPHGRGTVVLVLMDEREGAEEACGQAERGRVPDGGGPVEGVGELGAALRQQGDGLLVGRRVVNLVLGGARQIRKERFCVPVDVFRLELQPEGGYVGACHDVLCSFRIL